MQYVIRPNPLGDDETAMSINAQEFACIEESTEQLVLAERLCSKFSILFENYKDLELEGASISLDRITSGAINIAELRSYGRRFERRLLNYFSTYFAYEEFLSKPQTKQEKRFADLAAGSLKAARDLELTRAMKALRNYVQHYDLPLRQQIQGSATKDGTSATTFVPMINMETLDLKRVNHGTRAGLEDLKEIIRRDKKGLLQLIRGFTEILSNLNRSIQEATEADVDNAAQALECFRRRFRIGRTVSATIPLCAVEYVDEDSAFKEINLMLNETIDGIRQLRAVCGRHLFLDRQFISTEAKPR